MGGGKGTPYTLALDPPLVWIFVELHTERESPISYNWFSCASSVLVELEFEVNVFVKGRKLENLEKNPHSKVRPNKVSLHSQGCNQPQAPLGSKRSHHGTIPAPPHPPPQKWHTIYIALRELNHNNLSVKLETSSFIHHMTRQVTPMVASRIIMSCVIFQRLILL